MTDRPVLFAAYAGVLGGAERMLLDVVTRLERPAVVACPDGPLAAALPDGVPHVRLKERPLRTRPQDVFGFAYEIARKHRAAKLVAWGSRATMAATLTRRRFMAVHHDLYPRPAIRGAVRATTKRAAVTVATSRAIVHSLGLEATVIHPGVDLERFRLTPLPPGPKRALVAGALVGWKRPDLALEIASRFPELHVTFAGEPLPGEAFDMTPRANVTFAGRVDLGEALADAHVLLHCADQEPFGLVLIEALAAGRPVVAPDAGGPREIITGREGRLYPPGDADAAVSALRAVLGDDEAPERARARAADFSVEDTARRFREAIDAL